MAGSHLHSRLSTVRASLWKHGCYDNASALIKDPRTSAKHFYKSLVITPTGSITLTIWRNGLVVKCSTSD